MKIATYNIWNSEAGLPFRFQQIIDEITNLDADIICLQEVANREWHDEISALCGYFYSCYQEKTGLSILSRVSVEETYDFEFGTAACMQLEGKTILVTNVHLPWDSASLREKSIVDIVKGMADIEADISFLMGDFNSSADSSVHRFLTNEQSLLGCDAYFYDLAEAFADMSGKKPLATLDFRKNPRWGVIQPQNTIEVSQRFDWILLKNPYPAEFPVLKFYRIFGTKISGETGLAASDHYGALVEMEL